MAILDAENLDFNDLRPRLDQLEGVRVHVVGDTIVDSYTHCALIGGMTKTPTMSVRFDKQLDFVGGAGIVAKHLRAAGADVSFSTVLGNDALDEFALEGLEHGGRASACRSSIGPGRPRTKTPSSPAAIACSRSTRSTTARFPSASLHTLAQQIRDSPTDIVVFSDFRHGIFNRDTIPSLIDAIPQDTFRVADSQVASRWGNILEFGGFDLITPNEREARFALGDQDSAIRPLAAELYRRGAMQDADPQARRARSA